MRIDAPMEPLVKQAGTASHHCLVTQKWTQVSSDTACGLKRAFVERGTERWCSCVNQQARKVTD